MDIAAAGDAPDPVEPIDGISLYPLMDSPDTPGDTRDDVVYGEMLAESALGPLLMVKRGGWKYIHGDPDPAQLFNLDTDPLELENLSGNPAFAGIEADLAGEVFKQWNPETLKEAVLASQRHRLFLREVLAIGVRHPWDFMVSDEAAAHCLRGATNYNEWCYTNVLR